MKNSLYISQERNKTAKFRANRQLNDLLAELKRHLAPLQKELSFTKPEHPVVAIIGNPRSGTTVLLQWLASLGCFSYPTNVLTRFAYAPYIGALIQKLLFDPAYDFQGDFMDVQSGVNYNSELGKSSGAMATNEFQHFFRNYMPNYDVEYLDNEAVGKIDFNGINRGLASIERAFGMPFVLKATMLQYNIAETARQLPSLLWIYVIRDPMMIMQSLLFAREQYYGSRELWWSVKPAEYGKLKEMDVYHQIAGQVFFTDRSIQRELAEIPEARRLFVEYESFCERPKNVYSKLSEKYASAGLNLPVVYAGAESFASRNRIRLPVKDVDGLQNAYSKFADGSIVL